MLPFDLERVEIEPSKHVRNVKMRKWDWDIHDLRAALQEPVRIVPRGRTKLEVRVQKGGSKKLVFSHVKGSKYVFVITGTEG